MSQFVQKKAMLSLLFVATTAITISSQSAEDKELLLVLEVARHGARSPGAIFPFTVNPGDNFNDTNQLTEFGRQQHYNLGQFMRQKYVFDEKFISEDYDPSEVYTQCTFLNRTFDSAKAQMSGLYPGEEENQSRLNEKLIPDEIQSVTGNQSKNFIKDDIAYVINQVNQTYDLLTHVNGDNCAKDQGAVSDSKVSADYLYIQNYFFSNYLSNLEKLIGWDQVSTSDMYDICSYIYWAQIQNLTLNFTPSVLDNNYCAGLGDTKEYLVSYGNQELWELGSWEFAQQLIEFGNHLKNGVTIDEMPHFKKYYGLLYNEEVTSSENFPKMIIYLAHAETLMQYFDGLGFHTYQRPPPAAAIFFEFYRINEDIYVKLTYKIDPETTIDLKFPGQVDEMIKIEDLQKYLTDRFSKDNGNFTNINSECNSEYVSSGVFYSGVQTIADIAQIYGLVSDQLIEN